MMVRSSSLPGKTLSGDDSEISLMICVLLLLLYLLSRESTRTRKCSTGPDDGCSYGYRARDNSTVTTAAEHFGEFPEPASPEYRAI